MCNFNYYFRYFYLIVFAMYVREVGPKEYNQTFKQWMDDHADLREMIAEGRSKLEWERKIPDEKLMDLKTMLEAAEFKTNLPKVILIIFYFEQIDKKMFSDFYSIRIEIILIESNWNNSIQFEMK